MGKLQEKIQDVSFAMFVVRSLRKKYRQANQNFVCYQDKKDADIMLDDFVGGAHIIDANMPMRCLQYDSYTPCSNSDCPNHKWNNQYVDLLNRFRTAKQERNQNILNLFRIRQK